MKIKIKYLKDVTSPPNQVGKAGDIDDKEPAIANRLIAGGYAKKSNHKNKSKEGEEER